MVTILRKINLSKSIKMIMKRLNLTLIIMMLYCLSLTAQTKSIFNPKLEKRKGSEIGAKPCKYDAIPYPSVLVTPERLALIRKEVLQDKKGKKALIYKNYIKANADRWVNSSITIPKTGGWIHDFFCVDGTMLEIPKDRVFNSDIPSKCPVCGKTYLNVKILAARRSFEHYWLCGTVRDLSLVYAIEGKKEYAQKAIEILTKYTDSYPNGVIMDQSLEEAVNVIPLAEAYDLLYDVMTTAQRSYIKLNLLWPSAQALTKAGVGGNWGSWHLSAVGVIGYATRHQRFIDYATQQFKAQIKDQLGDDGLWPESINTYHFYPLDGFLAFVEAAANNGDNLYDWEPKPGKGIKAMFTSPLRYAYPNMRLASINDGWYDAYLPQEQYTLAYHLYKLPEFAWAIQQIHQGGKSGVPGDFLDQHYRDLLYGEALPQLLTKPVFKSINFPVLGIAILRQGSDLPADKEMMMTFDYGPLLGHGQPDKMGITLFANGKLGVPDYGTTGYGSAENRFLTSTPAHNTIMVDGKNQPGTKDRNLIAFKDTGTFHLASARTTQIVPGSSWTRTVMLADDYALVWDRIEGTDVHQYDWFFHAEGDSLSLSGISNDKSSTLPSAEEFSSQFITNVKKQTRSGNSAMAQWKSTDGGLGLWLMNNNPKQEIFTSKMPVHQGKYVPLLMLRQKSKQAEFLAVMKPLKGKKSKADINKVQFQNETNGDVLVTVMVGKRKDQIRLGKTEVAYEKGGEKPIFVNLPATK